MSGPDGLDDDRNRDGSGSYRDLQQKVKDGRPQRNAGRAHLYALEIPTSVIVGCVLGKLADDHFGIGPWGFVVGLLAGLGSAVRSIVRLVAWQKKNDEFDDAEHARDRGPDAR